MLASFSLHNFRCYQHFTHHPNARATAFLGPNGRGKTTLLEALYLLGRLRSFRTTQTRDLLPPNQTTLAVHAHFLNEEHTSLRVSWSQGVRRLEIDANHQATLAEFWGRFPVIIFRNEDRLLVSGPESNRRKWADALLALSSPSYLAQVQRAHLLLRQRTALLRQPRPDPSLWQTLVQQLDPLTEQLIHARATFASQLAAPQLAAFYTALSGRTETLTLSYRPDPASSRNLDLNTLWERERQQTSVLRGPHRDLWELHLNGHPLRTHGSEGQQKAAALSLRLIEVETLHAAGARRPTLLFDDVWIDLDAQRRQRFWDILPRDCPWFLATTDPAHLPSLPDLHPCFLPEPA